MAEMRVNPTRMELKKLQTRYTTARRGHKLLKDKRDELMRQFLAIVREVKELRPRVEAALARAYRGFAVAGAVMDPACLAEALLMPAREGELQVKERNVMSVTVPHFKYRTAPNAAGNCPYGTVFTSGELDASVAELAALSGDLLHMAELEKAARLLAEEIERTRRRVNALEHIMMPQYLAAIKTIKMKLDENERGNITRLMKVKDMMLATTRNDKKSFFPDDEEEA